MDQGLREKINRAEPREGKYGRTYSDYEALPQPPAMDRTAREIDSFVEAEHEQMSQATGIMRRIEDLADRLLGAVPTAEPTSAQNQKAMRSGHFGGMLDAHETRDSIYRRMSEALGRIEKVL